MATTVLQPNAKVVPPGIPLGVCFETHEDNIVILRGLVRDDLAECGDIGTIKDDLFLLRFLLSAKGNVEAAADNVRDCIQFRKGFLEEIQYVRRHKETMDHDEVSRFMAAGWVLSGIGELKHPTMIIRAGLSNIRTLMNSVPVEKVKRHMLMLTEIGYQRMDYLTRKTRRLVKTYRVLDLTGFSVSAMDTRFRDIQVDAAKTNSKLYPQLLGKMVVINANMAFRALFRMIRPLLPRSVLEKQTICPASGTSKGTANINQCPFIQRMNAVDQIPTFLGGSLEPPPFLQDPAIRPTTAVQHRVSGSRRKVVVEKEVSAEKAKLKLELLLTTTGKLTIEVSFQEEQVEEPLVLTSKHGLVKKEYEVSGPGRFVVQAANKSRYVRVLEVTLEAEQS